MPLVVVFQHSTSTLSDVVLSGLALLRRVYPQTSKVQQVQRMGEAVDSALLPLSDSSRSWAGTFSVTHSPLQP